MAKTLRVRSEVTIDGAPIPGALIDTSYAIDESVQVRIEILNTESYTSSISTILSVRAILVVSDQILTMYTIGTPTQVPVLGKSLLITGNDSTITLPAFHLVNNSGSMATVTVFVWGT